MAYRARRTASRRSSGRTSSRRSYSRSSTARRTRAPRSASYARGGNRAQTIRIVVEGGGSNLVQRPDGLMAARLQPTNGQSKF